MDMRRLLVIGFVTCSIPLVGCTSKSASNQLQPDAGPALSRSSSTAPFNDPRYQNLISQIENKKNATAWPDLKEESTTEKIGSAVKKASSSVASALSLKPKVVKAPDPVALDSMPDKINVGVYYQAGRLAESSGNVERAIKQYERALNDDPNHIASLISLARLHDRQDRFEDAERLYRRAIKAEPENAMAYNDLGLCLARHDQAQESVAALRHAVQLEPKRKLYRNNLATVLVDMGRVDEALAELKQVYPAAIAQYNLGYLLYQKGDKAQARQHIALACQADRSLKQAKEMLAQLDRETKPSTSPAGKVRYRVEDMVADVPQTTSNRGAQATPVAMVLSPRQLRRIPPTSAKHATPSPNTPAVRLQGPVPVDAAGSQETSPAPLKRIPEATSSSSSGMQLPAPNHAASLMQSDDSGQLPTPELLHEVAQHKN